MNQTGTHTNNTHLRVVRARHVVAARRDLVNFEVRVGVSHQVAHVQVPGPAAPDVALHRVVRAGAVHVEELLQAPHHTVGHVHHVPPHRPPARGLPLPVRQLPAEPLEVLVVDQPVGQVGSRQERRHHPIQPPLLPLRPLPEPTICREPPHCARGRQCRCRCPGRPTITCRCGQRRRTRWWRPPAPSSPSPRSAQRSGPSCHPQRKGAAGAPAPRGGEGSSRGCSPCPPSLARRRACRSGCCIPRRGKRSASRWPHRGRGSPNRPRWRCPG